MPFLIGGGLFALLLFIHIVIWRIRVPGNDALFLFVLFLAVPGVGLSALHAVNRYAIGFTTVTGTDLALGFILHSSLSLAYISNYPAATAHSPSLIILLMIGAEASGRLTGDEIARRYGTGHTIRRIEDLEVYGLLGRKGDLYILKPVARFIIRIYIIYRKLLGMPPGEG